MKYLLPAFFVGCTVGVASTLLAARRRISPAAAFPLQRDLSSIHNDVIEYSSNLQAALGAKNEPHSLSTDALANFHYMAVLCHRGVRTLCEEGWTPLCPILIRTMLDLCANCIAVVTVPTNADYMGFKYFAPLYMRLSTDPVMTAAERKQMREELDKILTRLPAKDQTNAKSFVKENRTQAYWYMPEYARPNDLLELSAGRIKELYRLFSGPAHGSFSGQVFFNDDPTVHDINPREHQNWNKRAVEASSRLLLEIARTQDVWDSLGHLADYDNLLKRITALM